MVYTTAKSTTGTYTAASNIIIIANNISKEPAVVQDGNAL